MYCTWLAENEGCKNYAKYRHLGTITQLCWAISLQLRHVSTTEKSLLNINIFSTCPHNMANVGPLMVEIGWWVLGTRANFNEFHILASLLHQRCSTEVNQTLHDVWWSPGLVHYIHFGGCCPLMEFCQMQNSLCVQVLRYLILAALLHCTRAVGVSLRGIFMFDIGSRTVISWLCDDYRIILRPGLCVVHMRQYNVVLVAQHRCSEWQSIGCHQQIHWYMTNMQLALLLACCEQWDCQ